MRESSATLPLSGAMFYILVSLADCDRNGAAITREVEELTGDAITLPPGTLYRLIKQLLADGWITEVDGVDDNQRRRYYRLTRRGREVARAEARRLDDILRVARSRNLLPQMGSA